MANLDEDTPTDGNSPTADDVTVAETGDSASGQAAEANPELRENQAQPAQSPPVPAAAAAPKPLPRKESKPAAERKKPAVARIHEYLMKSEDLLQEKELLVMSYVLDKCPRPYYQRWKEEANLVFTQAVRVKARYTIALKRRADAKKAS